MPRVPRYSREPFPAYRFVPGEHPHPTRDPAGHSFGRPEAVAPLSSETWRRCQPYLYAIDLFNHGYWWEAHEAFEPLWREAGRDTRDGRFLQGLIQVAAALLRRSMGGAGTTGTPATTGTTVAARGKAEEGIAKLRGAPDRFLGVDVPALVADVQACFDDAALEPPVITLVMPESSGEG